MCSLTVLPTVGDLPGLIGGDVVSDFTLKDRGGEGVTLSGSRGQGVVLSWHPLAWTSVCAAQMKNLEKHRGDFVSRGAVRWA